MGTYVLLVLNYFEIELSVDEIVAVGLGVANGSMDDK